MVWKLWCLFEKSLISKFQWKKKKRAVFDEKRVCLLGLSCLNGSRFYPYTVDSHFYRDYDSLSYQSPEQKCLVTYKNCHKILFWPEKMMFLTLRWPQKAFLKRPQVACYDVKMTCKKCYRKLNPKIGLCHVTQIMWSKITCCFTCLIFFPT